MKKRVIQINGLGGLLMIFFVIICLIAGFICFPALVCMHAWNYVSLRVDSVVPISFLGGLLLWGIIVTSYFIFHKRNLIVSFGIPNNMSSEELKDIFKKAETESPEEILKEIEKHKEN
jgi:hypothetical protein